MQVAKSPTGTVHKVSEIVTEDGNRANVKTPCGEWLYGVEVEDDGTLDAHPEDFGLSQHECGRCEASN